MGADESVVYEGIVEIEDRAIFNGNVEEFNKMMEIGFTDKCNIIHVPEGIEELIGFHLFKCWAIEEIHIPASVKKIIGMNIVKTPVNIHIYGDPEFIGCWFHTRDTLRIKYHNVDGNNLWRYLPGGFEAKDGEIVLGGENLIFGASVVLCGCNNIHDDNILGKLFGDSVCSCLE
jgi:hypothetical protein